MPCGCGRTYILNENYGFSNRRKKDTSFKSFMTFLLIVLLLCIVIYGILLAVSNRKNESLHKSDESAEHLQHTKLDTSTTNYIKVVDDSTTHLTESNSSQEIITGPEDNSDNILPVISSETTAASTEFSLQDVSKSATDDFVLGITVQNTFIESLTTESDLNFVSEEPEKTTLLKSVETTTEKSYDETTLYMSSILSNTTSQSEQSTLNHYNTQTPHSATSTITSESIFDVTTDRRQTEALLSKKESEASTLAYNVQNIPKDDLKTAEKENVCMKPACKEKTSQILQLMDHSVDLCEDFYQFSCGRVKNADDSRNFGYVDDLLKHIFTFTKTTDKSSRIFENFFGNCMKHESDAGYTTKIKQVFNSNVRDNNLTSLLSFLMLRQSTPLFEVRYGYVSEKEGYGMQILPPDSNYQTTGLKDWSLQSQISKRCFNFNPKLKYQSEVNLSAVYKDYNNCKENVFKLMAENFIMEKLDRTKYSNKNILRDFLSFFSKMNKISGQTLQNALLNEKYTKTYIDDLNEKYPLIIDWQDFFDKITGTEFDPSTPIFLYLEQEYFEQVMSDLRDRMLKTEKDVIETLLLYYQLELYQNLMAPKQNIERHCMEQAIQLIPEIAFKIYHDISGLVTFPYSSIENVYEELKEKFYWLIETSHIEEANKKEFKSSLEKLTLKFFEDDAVWRKYFVTSYESFYLSDDYLSNIFMFIENKRKISYLLRSEDEDFMLSQFVGNQFLAVPKPVPGINIIGKKGVYNNNMFDGFQSEFNVVQVDKTNIESVIRQIKTNVEGVDGLDLKMIIPSWFLNKLKEVQEYPTYIFESYLKFHLSRALALHLSDIDQKLKSSFFKQFLNSLNGYLENEGGVKNLQGQQVLYKPYHTLWQQVVQFSNSIRMADNIALDMAFNDIYIPNTPYPSLPWILNDYSPQQQFFILIAQEYCENPSIPALAQTLYETPNIPSILRIENMIINSGTFSKTFQCPQGTPMNPEVKTQFEGFVSSDPIYYDEYEQANK